jgi:hypothetical protein
MSYSDVFVIGAGPAGLTAGYLLTRQGLSTTLIEADPTYVGGISRTPGNKDFLFDIGGHRFFSKSKEAQDLWKEILPNDFIERPRPRRSRRHPSAAVALRPGERGRSGARLCPLPGLDQARPLARACWHAGLCGRDWAALPALRALRVRCERHAHIHACSVSSPSRARAEWRLRRLSSPRPPTCSASPPFRPRCWPRPPTSFWSLCCAAAWCLRLKGGMILASSNQLSAVMGAALFGSLGAYSSQRVSCAITLGPGPRTSPVPWGQPLAFIDW